MRSRKHHNNDGFRQIKRGRTREQVRAIAERLGVPYGKDATKDSPTPERKALERT